MLNKLKSLFSKPDTQVPHKEEPVLSLNNSETEPKPKKQAKPRKKKEPAQQQQQQLSEKEQATLAGEPYVSIISVDVDPNNINAGSFELDWNDKFVINLIKAGYKIREDDTDVKIVDRWFTAVCRNVVLETYEQQQADPSNREYDDMRRINTRDIGNGRTEVS